MKITQRHLGLKPNVTDRDKFIKQEERLLVKIDKQFTDKNSAFHLSVDELYIFFLLNANERRNGVIKTNLSFLEKEITLKSGSKSIKGEEIVEILYSLSSKGIIQLSDYLVTSHNNPTSLLDKDTIFYIRILYNNFEKAPGDKEKWAGFIQIPYNLLHKIKRPEHLYIYSVIAKYGDSYNKGFFCSYDKWAKILGKSTRTVKRHIQELIDLGIVFVNIGEYEKNSYIKQKVNVYRTYKFDDGEKSQATRLKEKKRRDEDLKKKIAFGDLEAR